MSLSAIVKATKAAASARKASAAYGHKIEGAEREVRRALAQLTQAQANERAGQATLAAVAELAIALRVARDEWDRLTKARRAAQRRWEVAQSILASYRLPGDDA